MSSSTLRIIAILLAAGALVLGYMGYKASQTPPPVSQETPQAAAEPERLPVLVAARDIDAGQPLDTADVTTMFVDTLPPDSYDKFEQVSGRQVRLPIAAGELVLTDHFYNFSPLVSSIRQGERAIAVRVDEVTGAGGFIEPGDSVDVLLFLAAGREIGDNSSAQRILSDVRVLAYGNSVDDTDVDAIKRKAQLNNPAADAGAKQQPDKADDDDKPSGKQSKTAVLAVAEKDLSSLLLAESTGRLRLALIGKYSENETKLIAVSKRTSAGGSGGKVDRQLVTLDQYKPAGHTTKPQPQVVRQATTRTVSPPTPSKVTVHRGTQEATVSVDREN